MRFLGKVLSLSALLLCVTTSHWATAQIIQSDKIIQQVNPVIDRINREIQPRLNNVKKLSEAELSLARAATAPLDYLPDELTIGGVGINQGWVEERVENGWRAVKNQWMGMADEATKNILLSLGATINSDTQYAGLKLSLIRFTVPEKIDSREALANYLPSDVMRSLDRNHVYRAQSSSRNIDEEDTALLIDGGTGFCQSEVRVGIVDSALEKTHTAFASTKITSKSFLINGVSSPSHHATAVASVLIGKVANQSTLLPKAHLYSAEVFYKQSDFAQGATLQAIIESLNWLVEENVAIINMSLAGPHNNVLRAVIESVIQNGGFIVAAAGNEGPAAPVLFPAGYDAVIAVSALDADNKPYRWSNQGDYIDYSAFGVNVPTAQPGNSFGSESGTSLAAPIVSAALACALAQEKGSQSDLRQKVFTLLSAKAIDFGVKGKDPIYGIGAILRD